MQVCMAMLIGLIKLQFLRNGKLNFRIDAHNKKGSDCKSEPATPNY